MISICKPNPDKISKPNKKIQRRKPKNSMMMTSQKSVMINPIQTILTSNNLKIMSIILALPHKINSNLQKSRKDLPMISLTLIEKK